MKKLFVVLLTAVMLCSILAITAGAANVTYGGSSAGFVYAPEDMFQGFKDLMPGDSVTETITVKNDASKDVNVTLYLRSLGATEESTELLSKLQLTVTAESGKELSATDAAGKGGLTDWTYLGSFQSGEETELKVTLTLPKELTNETAAKIGEITWEFASEEKPVESAPKMFVGQIFESETGTIIFVLAAVALATVAVLLIPRFVSKTKKDRDCSEE